MPRKKVVPADQNGPPSPTTEDLSPPISAAAEAPTPTPRRSPRKSTKPVAVAEPTLDLGVASSESTPHETEGAPLEATAIEPTLEHVASASDPAASEATTSEPAPTPKKRAPARSKKAEAVVVAEPETVAETLVEEPKQAKPSRRAKPKEPEAQSNDVLHTWREAPAKQGATSGVDDEPEAPAGTEGVGYPDEFVQISFRPVAKKLTKPETVAPTKAPEPVEETPGLLALVESELPILEWRTRPASPATTPKTAPTEAPERNSKGGRRRPKPEPTEVAAVIEAALDEYDPLEDEPIIEARAPAPVKPPAVPELPKKPAIAVPPHAPQIVVKNGVPVLVREHRIYPPIIFFGNASDERRAETVFEEMKMAAESEVHLHSFLVELCVDPKLIDESAGIAGYLLTRAVQIDPEAQIIFRIEFQSPRGWEEKYPTAVYRTQEGYVAEPSLSDEKYWAVAGECLELFVKKILLLDSASHILGLHLERGEWFQPADHGFDNSTAATKQFQAWARRRYLNDEVTLRASWFDGGARFDSISVPPFNPTGLNGDHFIRSSRKQRRYVDYHLFLSDETVLRISDLAYSAKKASEGMLLVGVSYGYTFEWSHPASGHLALGKLLRTDEIDFIAGPPSYRNRGTSGSAPFPCPIDSFALNGKLYLSEEDYKTSLSRGHEPDDFNPPLRTPQALESVHWRGVGAALAHAGGIEWMDLWGNGWLKTHSVWERAKLIRDSLINRIETPLGDPDVAVFIDERALAYLVDSNAFNLLVQSVRESVLRAGVSAGFYLLSDLQHREKFPESKLYLFLNAWDIRPELRAAIKSRLQRDNKVLFWLYAAGLFDAGRESLERAREVTGIALKPQPFHSRAGTTILNRRHPLVEAFPERSLTGEAKMEPSYFAIPEEGMVLGEYTQTGLPSFVVKEFKEDKATAWTSVFLGEPVVNPALIRALAQMAGAHIWNFHEDVVHVRGPFCTIHCSVTGPRTVTLPTRSCAYNVLTRDWVAIDATSLKFYGIDGSTHVFLVGQKGEIEAYLEQDPVKSLFMADIPARDSNVRVDSANFDVSIMKLDEWMEGGDQDDVADEWFLRPQAILEEETETVTGQAEESPEEVGKRRRKRRRSRGSDDGGFNRRQPQGEASTVTVESDDEFSMNVVFRKRE
jgi:hypothetical protein